MKRVFVFIFLCTFAVCSVHATPLMLTGTEKGLYKVSPVSVQRIWDANNIRKVLKSGKKWFFLTGDGIAQSTDLVHFSYVNTGLPEKVIKQIHDDKKIFVHKIQMLKDLEAHPLRSDTLVTATNSDVFLTRNGGVSWENLGCHTRVNGIKAVSVLDLPDEAGNMQLTVFVSHGIFGVAWKQPDVSDTWHSLDEGLQAGPEGDEEVGDIAIRSYQKRQEVYAVQTFTAKLYVLNWAEKRFSEVTNWVDGIADARCVDGIACTAGAIVGCKNGSLFEIPLVPTLRRGRKTLNEITLNLKRIPDAPLSAWIPRKNRRFGKGFSLSELWMLNIDRTENEYEKRSAGKKGVYLPAYQAKTEKGLQRYFDLLESNKLNMLVIDMKDDFGSVRYDSEDPEIQAVGSVRPFIKLDEFTAKARERNIYLVARIVTFKDKRLYRYQKNRYAVKTPAGKPWQGYKTVKGEDGLKKEQIEEYWVDPYNEKVWEYNIRIAQELVRRGFDEIQFDYIRFPTDGENLYQARYPAREQGMDKESALMSFLSYARERIDAPISIDIYGANGWYRTGARTGQEVEVLADYVDVICPMFYPSHFRQSFLAYPPAKERPYRIYKQGTYRNKCLARNKAVIRPWTQAFYIPVSYDRKFYDEDYVQRQILGVRDAFDEGYAYWNNSGRYSDIRPDGMPLPKK